MPALGNVLLGLLATIAAGLAFYDWWFLPTVQKSILDNSCVTVVNARKGDNYSCADVGVKFKAYDVEFVDPRKGNAP